MQTFTTEEMKFLQLLENGIQPSDDMIANKLKIDISQVKKLRDKFENDGIILKYKAIINWEKIESQDVVALIQVSVQTSEGVGYDKVAKAVADLEEVQTCFLLSGSFDLLVEVEGKSLKQVAFFVADRLSTMKGIKHTKTNFLLKRYKQNGDILSASKTYRLPIVI